eukprot:TRINITY_DN22087_c0_g1_i1.p1 TRINITY_DN22087_c0_g1~~TRINITY_DN22087_c0_g1_i1.p1  ORF type:complete len:177 (+),score=1.87 TRINITY_DN22087_c0_g1_i1:91-621(+)
MPAPIAAGSPMRAAQELKSAGTESPDLPLSPQPPAPRPPSGPAPRGGRAPRGPQSSAAEPPPAPTLSAVAPVDASPITGRGTADDVLEEQLPLSIEHDGGLLAFPCSNGSLIPVTSALPEQLATPDFLPFSQGTAPQTPRTAPASPVALGESTYVHFNHDLSESPRGDPGSRPGSA